MAGTGNLPGATQTPCRAYLQELEGLHDAATEAVVLAQRHWPRAIRTVSLHLMTHLPAQIEDLGPLRGHWAFGAESLLGLLRRLMRSHRHPVESALAGCLRVRAMDVLQPSTEGDEAGATLLPSPLGVTMRVRKKVARRYSAPSSAEVQHIRCWLAASFPAEYDALCRQAGPAPADLCHILRLHPVGASLFCVWLAAISCTVRACSPTSPGQGGRNTCCATGKHQPVF